MRRGFGIRRAIRRDRVSGRRLIGDRAPVLPHDSEVGPGRIRRGLDLAEYHGWLEQRLPRYMVPRYLELRPAFPKTPSERIEKYKLAQEGVDRAEVREFAPTRR